MRYLRMVMKGEGLRVERQPNARSSVTLNGQEVENPWLRQSILAGAAIAMPLIATAVILFSFVMIFVGFFMAMIGIFVTLPLGLLLDKPLKALGRRGCVIREQGKVTVELKSSSFRRLPRVPAPPSELDTVIVEPGVRSRPSGIADDKR